jgi:hypothetical protein
METGGQVHAPADICPEPSVWEVGLAPQLFWTFQRRE